MPKFGSGWSSEEKKPSLVDKILGRTANDSVFQNANIDKSLKRGLSAARIKAILSKDMAGLSKAEKDKIMRRIDTRETKYRQGKSDGNKGKK